MLRAILGALLLVGPATSLAAPPDDEIVLEVDGDDEEIVLEVDGDDGEIVLEVDDSEGPSSSVPAFEPRALVRGSALLETRADLERGPAENVFELHARGDLSADVELSHSVQATLSGRLRAFYVEQQSQDGADWPFAGDSARWHAEPELRDLFVSWRIHRLALRVGSQVISWGHTDLSRPLDVLNPYDYREALTASTEVPAVPVPAARFDLRVTPDIGLQIVYVPFFEPHRFTLFGGDAAPLSSAAAGGAGPSIMSAAASALDPTLWDEAQPLLQASERPSNPILDAQVGAGIFLRLGGFDASAHYAFVHDRYPWIEVDAEMAALLGHLLAEGIDGDALGSLLADPELSAALRSVQARGAELGDVWQARYRRSHMAGASARTTLGDLALKLDAAYFHRRTLYTETFQPTSSPTLAVALSADYVYETSFDLTAEIGTVAPLDVDEGADLLIVEEPWTLLMVQARLRLLDDESLQLQAGGLVGADRRDRALNGSIRWRIDGAHAVSGGVGLFGGPDGSLGGMLRRNDAVWLRYEAFL